MIICAAIKCKDQIIRCHRHWHWYLAIKTFLDVDKTWRPDNNCEWFVDSYWHFKTRQEAFILAYKAKQISKEVYTRTDKDLYSEDLY